MGFGPVLGRATAMAAAAWVTFAGCQSDEGGSGEEECKVGTVNCPCTSGLLCDYPLVCEAMTCVDPNAGGSDSGGATDAGGSGTSGSGTGGGGSGDETTSSDGGVGSGGTSTSGPTSGETTTADTSSGPTTSSSTTDATPTTSSSDTSSTGVTDTTTSGPDTQSTGPALCGDGSVGGGEACDDGNQRDGDGCDASCEREWTLATVACGFNHACAIVADGQVKCWGTNTDGQLGQGDTTKRGDGPGEMGANLPPIDLGTGARVVEIGAGFEHTCARLDDDTIKCWGGNSDGQLGLGDTLTRGDGVGEMGNALPTVSLGTNALALQLVTGRSHNCARLSTGDVKCWGRGTYGATGSSDTDALGDNAGEMGEDLAAVPLGTGRTAVAIAAMDAGACAVLDDDSVKCWGANSEGELGLGDDDNRGDGPSEMGDLLPAIDLGTGRTAVAIASGPSNHQCAVLDDASVKCWGYNAFGELGLGDTENRGDHTNEMGDMLPTLDLAGHPAPATVSAGRQSSCALFADGSLVCWGGNSAGELGQEDEEQRGDETGEMGTSLPAIDLGTGRHVVDHCIGSQFTCARLDDDTVKCWGLNNDGELGQGSTDPSIGGEAGDMGDNLPPIDL